MKMYGILLVGFLLTASLWGMQEDNSDKFLQIQNRIKESNRGVIIQDVDYERSQNELQRVDNEIKLSKQIIIRDEIKKLQVSCNEISNDLEWLHDFDLSSKE